MKQAYGLGGVYWAHRSQYFQMADYIDFSPSMTAVECEFLSKNKPEPSKK